MVIGGTLEDVALPKPLVIIAHGWSNALVVALLLGFPIRCIYAESLFLSFIKPLLVDSQWLVQDFAALQPNSFGDDVIVVVTGAYQRIPGLKNLLFGLTDVIWFPHQQFRAASFSSLRRGLHRIKAQCRDLGLEPVQFLHSKYGGVTNAMHACGWVF